MQVRDLPVDVQPFATAWLQVVDGFLDKAKMDPDPARRKLFADQAQVAGYTLRALGVDRSFDQPPPLVTLNLYQASAIPKVSEPSKGDDAPPPMLHPQPAPSQSPVDTSDLFSKARVDGPLSEDAGRRIAIAVARQLQIDFQLTPQQAAGIVGNLWHESAGMNSNVNEFGSDPSQPTYGQPNKTLFGYGWAQWTGERKTAYISFCEANQLEVSSPAANYAFLKHELLTTESVSLSKVREASTVDEAARNYMLYNERPTMPVYDKRVAAAEELYTFTT